MKKFFLSIIIVLTISMTGCGEKYARMNTVKDLSLFGGTPEEAGELLGISFSGIEPETENDNFPNADVYRMPEQYLIGGYPADVEFAFYRNETPKGNPLGLTGIVMYFASDIDMKQLSEEIGTVYELDHKFSYGIDENDEVNFFSWSPFDVENQTELLGEAIAQTADLTGVSERSPYFTIEGYRNSRGYVLVYVVGVPSAVKNHIDDYDL